MRKILLAATAICAVVVGNAFFTAPVAAQNGNSRVQRGYDLSPVPLNTKGLNPALVGEGSYIVNTSGCNDCHTNPSFTPGHDPFLGQPEQINTAGFLGGGTPFGPFTSRNLTPNRNREPGGLSLTEFLDVMHNGTDYENAHPMISPLLQVMPWPVYGKMSDNDLKAIYAYLQAIPCIGSVNRCGA
jgi:hypothetical protein